MNTPVFLIGAALIFWGLQVNLLLPAGIMAVVLESSRWLKIRWKLSDKGYSRIVDLCVYLSVAVMAFAVLTGMNGDSVMRLFGWMPLLTFPIMLAQVYGERNSIHFSALSLIARHQIKEKQNELQEKTATNRINVSFIYLALCLLSSGVGNNRSPWFYVILFGLAAWALWVERNPAYPAWLSLILLLTVGCGGFAAQIGLQDLQDIIEAKTIALMIGNSQGGPDPFHSQTAIGSIGELKLSDEIIYRISTTTNSQPPKYLRNGSYNVYRSVHGNSSWQSSPRAFDLIQSGADRASWQIHPSPSPNHSQESQIVISTRIASGEGILPVPLGTISLANLPVETVGLSKLGAVQLTGTSGLFHTTVRSIPTLIQDFEFTQKDLFVPNTLRPMLKKVLSDNNLLSDSPENTVQLISNFFKKDFSYSLVQKEPEKQGNALEHFLTESYTGHCEFFATSTVLLARMAGIPARYATGSVVDEFSEREQCYLVRARHAHAWTMLFVGDQWQLLDTTSSNWLTQEAESSSFLTPVRDFFSWCRYRFSVWRTDGRQGMVVFMYWLFAPVVLVGLYFFFKKRTRPSKHHAKKEPQATPDKRGMDSAFFLIAQYFTESGYSRHTNERLPTGYIVLNIFWNRIYMLKNCVLSFDTITGIALMRTVRK